MDKYLWLNLTTLLAVYDKDNNLLQRFEYADGRMPYINYRIYILLLFSNTLFTHKCLIFIAVNGVTQT